MADGCEQGGAQPFGFRVQAVAIDILREVHTFDGERGLIGQCVEQPALIRRQQRAGLFAIQPDDADGAASRAHRQEQPFGAGQRIRAAPRRRAMFPHPFGGGEIGFIQHVFRRITGAHRNALAFRQQDHDAQLQHLRELERRRPEQIVQGEHACQLATEEKQIFRRLGAFARNDALRPHPRRQIAGDESHDGEEEQRVDILRIGDT